MVISEKKRLTFTAIAVVVVGIVTGLLLGNAIFASGEALPRSGFPSFVYTSDQSLQAYEAAMKIAIKSPEVLPVIPCYCGCGEVAGHKNLKDCFFKGDGSFDDHGAFCDVCQGEVLDVAKWEEEGYSLKQIRGLIDEKYGHGKPTDTPPLL